jgi:glycosidase
MLHFLDNHDEQRLASPEFAGSAENGKPLMVISAMISSSPTMVYFGQEVGEPGNENAGFGTRSRTSIFDYIGVPEHQKWMNGGKFDGGALSSEQLELRDFYKRLLNFTSKSNALMGSFGEIQRINRASSTNYGKDVYSFVRYSADEKLIITSNISKSESSSFELIIPAAIISQWNLKDGSYNLVDQLYLKEKATLQVTNGVGHVLISLAPSESFIFKVK